jgi:hypothetical protein
LVVDTSLVIFWIEDKSWVSSHLYAFSFIGSCIEFGNNEVIVVLIELTKLIPDWSELFAVTAPWGVVLDKDILGWILYNILEV